MIPRPATQRFHCSRRIALRVLCLAPLFTLFWLEQKQLLSPEKTTNSEEKVELKLPEHEPIPPPVATTNDRATTELIPSTMKKKYRKATSPAKRRWEQRLEGKIQNNGWGNLNNQTCLFEPTHPSPLADWQRRAPYFMILGAMKGGTRALRKYLAQHPRVVPCQKMEQHFFDYGFERFATPQGIHRRPAQLGYARLYRIHLARSKTFWDDENLIAMDNTPGNIFWSDRIPARVLCVAPWAKLIVILRNPVDRAYSHYVYTLTENKASVSRPMLHQSFENWAKRDMYKIKKAGLLEPGLSLKGELLAFKRYLRSIGTRSTSVLGRGLYALQLQHWYDAMTAHNKSHDDLLVLNSQDLKDRTQETVDKATAFLQLPHHELEDTDEKHTGHYWEPMDAEFRRELEAFFEPYNKRLYELLGWDPVWG